MTKRLDYNQIAPNGTKALGGVKGYVMQSGLPAELVALVYLRVSQINNCAYCLDMHTRDLTKKGAPIETVTRVAQTGVPDDAYQAARAVFGEKELVDFTIAISLMNAYNRMAISFRNTPQAAIKN